MDEWSRMVDGNVSTRNIENVEWVFNEFGYDKVC
jgi:hypothetical protein